MALSLALGMAQTLPIQVQDPFVRLVPPNLKDSAAYMTLINTSDKPLRLIAGSTPAAAMLMLMEGTSEMKGEGEMKMEVKGMRGVKFLEIPAKGKLVLKPGGNHLMLMGLKQPLQAGQKVKLTLKFEGGQSLNLETTVQAR